MPPFPRALLLAALCAVSVAGARAQATSVQPAGYAEILDDVRSSDDAVTVVNMWATWCAPCVAEFPVFMELDEALDGDGVDVVFVSVDFEDEGEAVQAFLDERGWTGRAYLRTGPDHEFVNAFHEKWSGAVPATFVYGADGELLTYWEGEVASYDDLHARVAPFLAAR